MDEPKLTLFRHSTAIDYDNYSITTQSRISLRRRDLDLKPESSLMIVTSILRLAIDLSYRSPSVLKEELSYRLKYTLIH